MRAFSKNNDSRSNSAASRSQGADSFFGVQTKLSIGKSDDKYEKEADSVADKVVEKTNQPDKSSENSTFFPPVSKPMVQKSSQEEVQKQEETEEIQEKPISESITPVVQMATDDDEAIQKMPFKEVQQKSDSSSNQEASPGLESSLNSSKGGGSPLPSETKEQMESGFGTDFSNVRVHNDDTAVQMNKELGSQAFASGNDIYFNEGKYNPGSKDGQHLLAHELTHTLQQGASIKSKLIQRDEDESDDANTGPDPPAGMTNIDVTNGVFKYTANNLDYEFSRGSYIKMPVLRVPRFKERHSSDYLSPVTLPATLATSEQGTKWPAGVSALAASIFTAKIDEAEASGGYDDNSGDARVYFFKGNINPNLKVFGTRNELLDVFNKPFWDQEQRPTGFDIDHALERQLGGQDNTGNYELLESGANSSSGSILAWEMNKMIKEVIDDLDHPYFEAMGQDGPQLPARPARQNSYVNQYKIELGYQLTYNHYSFNLETTGQSARFWPFNLVSTGTHTNALVAMTPAEVREMGSQDDPALFFSAHGGERIDTSPTAAYPIKLADRLYLKQRPNFDDPNPVMNIEGFKAGEAEGSKLSGRYNDMSWPLIRKGQSYVYYVNKQGAIDDAKKGTTGVFQSLNLPGMSPIRIDELNLNENGFQGIGKVLPTVPLIADADIDIVIDGGDVRMRKLFSAEEFSFPPPFVIDRATLEVSFGTDGLGVAGRVDFGINSVGTGHIEASASTGSGFALAGAFNFDSELFDPAEISVEYIDNVWTIGGRIGIPEGKIRGVKSATIMASYSEDTFTATGEAELDVPGIERGTMTVEYGESGFSIGGTFQLKNDIPGIRGGSVSATISKEDGAEAYDIMVTGTAQPDIPGINSSLTVTYDNGALTIAGSAAYARGMLSGTVNVGATNRAIGDDGQPGGDPDDTMRVYGGGSLTLRLTPWLEATAGIQFLPNGEIEVTGRIGLPDSVDVFDRKSIDRNLFNMPAIEIPIFAIPLGPRSLGLVARITGGLDFSAGFGPGQLRNLYADVTYNPDREDETTITGHGEFAIPADAGLTLRGDLGLGLSVGIASLTGGIEIAGTLGLEGEAAAEVDVNWSPQTGLAIDATGRITVNPKFTFDINAFARASLDLWLVSISETWRYNLASFSWGPDIQFGIVFPIHYREGEPFDMSFDDIEVIYPELDIGSMASGLARDVKDDIF